MQTETQGAARGPVERLSLIRVKVRKAQGARLALKSSHGQIDADAALEDYVRCVDAIFAELVALEEIGALDELERAASVFWGRG